MPDYQAMYAILFRKITTVIEDLQYVQHQTEEMFISSHPPDIRIFNMDKVEDEQKEE